MGWFGPVLLGVATGLAILMIVDWCIERRKAGRNRAAVVAPEADEIPDLAEAESKVRTFLAVHGDDNMERVMVEYDRLREMELRAINVRDSHPAGAVQRAATYVLGEEVRFA